MAIFRRTPSGIIASAHAQVPKDTEGCSVATLNGAYGFFRTGITSAGPLAAVGIATFDGTGAVSAARQTIRKNGITVSDLFTNPALSGPYEVDSDCAGRFLNPDGTVFGHFVVVYGGNELFILSLLPIFPAAVAICSVEVLGSPKTVSPKSLVPEAPGRFNWRLGLGFDPDGSALFGMEMVGLRSRSI